MQELELIASSVPDTETRNCRRIEIGTAIHQGDVYVHRVADDWERGAPIGSRQVAVGTNIGSRHIAEGSGVTVYAGKKLPDYMTPHADIAPGDLLGPVVVATETWTLTHPEHAHHCLPAGTYQVTYQGDLLTRRRVVD